jgi:integrase
MSEISYLFWLRKNQVNKYGETKVYCRIQDNFKRVNFSTGISVKPEFWHLDSKRVTNFSPRSKIINEKLDRIEQRLMRIQFAYLDKGKPVSPEIIKNEYFGKTDSKSLFDVFLYYINQHQRRSTKRTLNNYYYTKQRISQFAIVKKNRSDIYLSEVNLSFVTELENYLCNDQSLKPISANKHTQRLKTIMKFAAKLGYIPFNPLTVHEKLKEQKKEIIFLDLDELTRLESRQFRVERLNKIRDLFVFSCYTGLAYSEIKELKNENLTKGLDGKLWLNYYRFKTLNSSGRAIKIPLLSKALAIIQKYSIDPEVVVKDRLLPVPSNQKFNAYLKEIADLCEINKELTTHVARKTFATTVTLANDVPIETVSQALGHTDIKITQQYYAKVVPQKMMRDMQKLEKKLSSKKKGKKKKKSS